MRRMHRVVLGIIITAACVFFGDQAHGQQIDHMPTLEQCRADVQSETTFLFSRLGPWPGHAVQQSTGLPI
jgi:hypothetical protein